MTTPDSDKALGPDIPEDKAALASSAGDAPARVRKPRRTKAEIAAAAAAAVTPATVAKPVESDSAQSLIAASQALVEAASAQVAARAVRAGVPLDAPDAPAATVAPLSVAPVAPVVVAVAPVRPQAQVERDDQPDDEDEEDEPDEEEDDLDRARRQADREQRGALPPQPISFSDVVSGQFDADEEDEAVPVLKRVLLPEADAPKLHKVLAQAGLGSRLEMEQLILQGRISVNNEPAHIGQRIQFGDSVKFNGKPVRFRIAPPPARVIAYHKPVGEVVTHDDPQNRPTVFRKLPRLQQGKWQSVGRLDLNTEGLLLLTSSGELANQLTHPRFGLEREYAVRVLGALSKEEKVKLLEGVRLDDGPARFGSIEEGGGEGANHWYRVTISEGRNREVRRMFEAVGHAVSRLIRIRYGAMLLPRGLKRGAWMELDEGDIRQLMRAVGQGEPRMEQGARDDMGGARGNRNNNGGDGNRNDRNGGGNDRQRGNRNGSGGPRSGTRQRPAGAGEQPADPMSSAPAPRSYFDGVPTSGGGNGAAGDAGGGRGARPAGRGPGGGNGANRGNGGGNGGAQGQPRRQDGKNRGTGDRPPNAANQPDPLKTSLGYIGADSLSRQRKEQRQGPARRGSGGGNGGPPSGPPGGNSNGPRRNRGR